MKETGLVGLASLLPLIAIGWISAAASSGHDQSAATRAAEYVYLHQTRHAASALQHASDRSRLKCVPE